VGNDEEAGEYAEGERGHGEKIHRRDGFTMIAKEGSPSLCRIEVARRFAHPPQDSSLREVEAEHLQFTMNARRAPGGVLCDHAVDEIASLIRRHFLPAGFRWREIQRQYNLNPARCQPTTVSGWTMRSACFHPDQIRRT